MHIFALRPSTGSFILVSSMEQTKGSLLHTTTAKVVFVLFIFLVGFWAWIRMQGLTEGNFNNFFGALYPVVPLIGGIYGLYVARTKWGGSGSYIGKAISFLSYGLLAEVFAQWAWSYYTIVQGVQIPYPSIADIGYFAIVPFYSYAMYNFAKAAGVSLGLRSLFGKILAIVVPIIMFLVAYFMFLKNIQIDPSNPIKTFLDFGYPGFEVIAVSLAILTYSLSANFLGGIMRSKILFVIFALVFQYITDSTFLYQVANETYFNGGIVDLLYTISFTIMALAVINFTYTNTSE